MRHKRLRILTMALILGCVILAYAGVGTVLVGGDDLVFRGGSWDVRAISNDITISDEGVATKTQRYAEMFGAGVTVTLDAGVFANITGLTNGIVSSDSMTQNSTDGSITVTKAGVYEAIGSMSMSDPDSPSETYCFTYGVDGTEVMKCVQHRDISIQSAHGTAPVTCLLDLLAGEVVTMMSNTAGGDDLQSDRLNWYLKEL